MRAVDEVILATARATGVNIYDGDMVPVKSKTVDYPIPYAVFFSSVGDDGNARLSGRDARRSVPFSFTFVGVSREQAKWAGERLHGALHKKRLVVPGHRTWLCKIEESQRIRRDDDAIRPDGSPLFYGVMQGALSIALKH